MIFDPTIITHHLADIGQGFMVTLGTWSAGVALGLLLGLLIAVAQLFGNSLVRAPLRVFIEMIRSTPFLVQLFLVYYGGPSFGLSLTPFRPASSVWAFMAVFISRKFSVPVLNPSPAGNWKPPTAWASPACNASRASRSHKCW